MNQSEDVSEQEGRSGVVAEIPYVASNLDRVSIDYASLDQSFAVEHHRMRIKDMRALRSAPTLDKEGFCYCYWPSTIVAERRAELIEENSRPREDRAPVNTDYMNELLPLIEELAAGAREVFAQYDTVTVRFSANAKERSWMRTSAFAHLDFEKSHVDRLLNETLELTKRTVKPFKRQILFQTWRAITQAPQDEPLTLCDGRTVDANDVVPMDFHGPKGSRNEFVRSRAGKYNPKHQWYYLRDMSPDEVLIFKGYDSNSPDAGNAMHTAFRDTSIENPVPRGSIELRFIALYD